jgi:RNA polymerase sigma-70 factor (ECF subfamily)
VPERGDKTAQWLPAARAGSLEALGQALEAYRGYLLVIAQEQLDPDLRAKGGASDLVQETFLKAHQHFASFHGDSESELLAWLRRMLLNNLTDFRRFYRNSDKRQVEREVVLGGDSSACGGDLAAQELSPSGLAMQNERGSQLERALARLPEDQRQVLLLRHQQELSWDEVGRLMNRSADAARKLWARAVERLQHEGESPS